MAVKKYVSLEKLGLYDEKIKALINSKDTTTLDSAKEYADGLASNYEAAGSVNTAKTELQGNIDAVEIKADAAQAAAAKAQGEVDALESYVGTFTASEGVDTVVKYIDAKTANVASDEIVEALTTRVTQAETDIDNIEKDYLKTADKTELSDAITAEQNRATGIEGGLRTDVDAIKADYLKAADLSEGCR